jgi:peptide/nickel transport system permease protein
MLAFILRRVMQSVFVVIAMSLVVFFGVHVVGDPVYLLVNPMADQRDIEIAIKNLGLDLPIWQQYWNFVTGALKGDFGKSFIFGESALKTIIQRMPATLELAFVALLMAIVLGIPLGLYAGLYPERKTSKGIMASSIVGFSLPTFWVGLMLIMFFAVMLKWLPSGNRGPETVMFGIKSSLWTLEGWRYVFLPALNLALLKISLVIRLTYAGTRETIHQDFIKFARAKGLKPRRVIGVHLMKTIMIPVITVLGLELGNLVAFSVVTESIFSWPGMGRLLIDSIRTLDRPIIVAYLILIVLMFVVINLIVDILYSILDPRVRLGEKTA